MVSVTLDCSRGSVPSVPTVWELTIFRRPQISSNAMNSEPCQAPTSHLMQWGIKAPKNKHLVIWLENGQKSN